MVEKQAWVIITLSQLTTTHEIQDDKDIIDFYNGHLNSQEYDDFNGSSFTFYAILSTLTQTFRDLQAYLDYTKYQ